MAIVAGAIEAWAVSRTAGRERCPGGFAVTAAPLAIAGLVHWLRRCSRHWRFRSRLALAAVTALGPLLYRIVYQPLAEASVLVLLIVSVAVHLALTGLGLCLSAPRFAHAAVLQRVVPDRRGHRQRAKHPREFEQPAADSGAVLFRENLRRRYAPPRSTVSAQGSSAFRPIWPSLDLFLATLLCAFWAY